MRLTTHIMNAMHVAGFWLVMLCVFLGPLGIGSSVATASLKTCGGSCPCDEDQWAEHAEAESNSSDDGCAANGIDHQEEAPCDDECPDACPECSCCPGLTAGIVPSFAPTVSCSVFSSKVIAPLDAPAAGALSGVFRPPRSLT